jgi:chemotaxis protein methyltransferase CheR
MDEYLARLQAHPGHRAECRRQMTVSISRFFRDLRLWEILEARVLPELAAQQPETVKVWSAGCAGGEEVYSFRILWETFAAKYSTAPRLKMIATDLAPQYLERAKKGIYPNGALRDADTAKLNDWFFHVKKDRCIVRPWLKNTIDWRVQDLLSDPPPAEDLDLVFLRNSLLTYYLPDLSAKPLQRVINALKPGGFLVIGAKEQIPEPARNHLTPYDRYVFRKNAG